MAEDTPRSVAATRHLRGTGPHRRQENTHSAVLRRDQGFIVNFTPDHAVEFDTDGNVVASFEKAYRPGEVEIFIGKHKLPAGGLFGLSPT